MRTIEPLAVPQGGAVAFRKHNDVLEVLIVRPSSGKDEWLFPKGHIKANEAERQTASRELREEAGVIGRLIGAVDDPSCFRSNEEDVAVRFVVFEAVKEEPPTDRGNTFGCPFR